MEEIKQHCEKVIQILCSDYSMQLQYSGIIKKIYDVMQQIISCDNVRFLYNGIIIKHQKTEPTYTKTSLFLCEKRRFFMARREKGVVPIIYFEKERGKSF